MRIFGLILFLVVATSARAQLVPVVNGVVFNGSASGQATLQAPSAAGSGVVTLPAAPATLQTTTGAASANPVTATGSTTARTLAARFSQVVNIRDYGALGNGVADDSGALKAAINAVNTAYAAGVPAALYLPTGWYYIKNTNGAMPEFAVGVPGAVIGDGPNKSVIWLDSGYAGDTFSWSGASSTVDFPGNTVTPSSNLNTPLVEGITIIGNTGAASQQNALMFYDLDDAVTVQDVEIYSMPGYGISMGLTKNASIAYVRESFFKNVKCWNCGKGSIVAAIYIGSTTSGSSDATNEISFYKLDVFRSAGPGVVISNHNNVSATRGIKFFGLRVEDTGGDGLDIGLPTDLGQVAGVDVYEFDAPNVNSATNGVKITTGGSNQPYTINFIGGTIGPGAGNGIDIDNARQVHLVGFSGFSVSGTDIIFGANAGADTSFNGGSLPPSWTYSYSAVTGYGALLNNLTTPYLAAGLPGSMSKVGVAAMQGTTASTAVARLTMNGAAANAQNCFNPSFSQGFNLAIQLMAQDTGGPSNEYSWTLPVAYFSAFSGAGTAYVNAGTPQIISNGTLIGAGVSLTADTTNGCINLTWTPPTGNTDTWNVTALITYARAP